jgi:hypothetical protein
MLTPNLSLPVVGDAINQIGFHQLIADCSLQQCQALVTAGLLVINRPRVSCHTLQAAVFKTPVLLHVLQWQLTSVSLRQGFFVP